jgi:hypothetical protein
VLERLQVTVRLRGNWEALDLGACLLRRYGGAVYAVWLPLVGPFALLLALLLHRWPWAAALAFWWFKPVYDRLVLHVLGRAAFGSVPSLRDTLKDLPAIYRRGTLAGLLWRRLSPQRSYLLPVWQLEDQHGDGFRRRVRPLLRRGRFTAQALTLGCLNFESVLQLGLLAALQLLVPKGSDFNVFQAIAGTDGAASAWASGLLALLPFLSATAIEPYFVAAGFGLYLNRRVQLEAWDLELAFRKLAARLVRAAVLALALAAPLQASVPSAPARIEEVLKAPEFQTTRMEKGLHWKARKPTKAKDDRRPPWFDAVARVLAGVLKWAFILAALAMVGWFLWRIRARFGLGGRDSLGAEAPATLFGLDLRPESLPRDVEAAARALLREGRWREALALLYRASLARLVGGFGLDLPRGATEGDCLRLASRVLPPETAAFFSELTAAWQGAAYAHRPPADGEALCRRWTAAFEGPR